MLSRRFVNAHLRYGTKPLMAFLRDQRKLRWTAGLYAKTMFPASRDMSFAPDRLVSGSGSVDILWCSMQAVSAKKVILYLHGGGFTLGDDISHGAMVARIAGEVGLRAAMVDYRLAPEHPYPAAIDDAQYAYEGLLERGYAGDDIILIGDSAGGGLVFTLLQRLQRLGLAKPLACVAISPWGDLSMSGASFSENIASDIMLPIGWITRARDAYVGDHDPKGSDLSPIFGTFDAPPPSFLVVAKDELLASDSYALRDMLRDAGGEVEFHEEENLPHVWTFYHGKFAQADQTIRQIGDFAKRHL